MLALASVILIPAYFVSANEEVRENQPCAPIDGPQHPPAIPFEITSISESGDGSGSIQGTLERVPERLTEEEGVEEGDTVTVAYTSETKFMVQHEEGSIDSFAVGDIAFALGVADFEAMTIDARAVVDKPLPPKMHVGEVVEVDTQANTILVKAMRPNDEGEEEYAYVTYDADTTIKEDGDEADESAISVGDLIRLEGTFNWESEEYLVEIDADHIVLFDEELPPRPGHGGGRPEVQTE